MNPLCISRITIQLEPQETSGRQVASWQAPGDGGGITMQGRDLPVEPAALAWLRPLLEQQLTAAAAR